MDRLTGMEAFVRVVNAGSFTGAAKQWGRSKGAVSKYVAELEDHLGVQLLQRTTRAMHLTDTGRSYYARCVDLLGELAAAEASVRDAHVSPRGWLRVTAPPGFAERFDDVLTHAFVNKHPGVRVELELTHRMVDLVEEGFDVAIRVTAPRDSSLIARRLAPAPLVAVASPAYLAARGTPESPSDLAQHDCLVDTNFRERERWHFRAAGRAVSVDVDGPFRINSPLAVRDLAARGYGVALVPRFLADTELESGALVEVLPGMPAFDWSIFAVYPRRRHLPARVRAFVDHLVETLG